MSVDSYQTLTKIRSTDGAISNKSNQSWSLGHTRFFSSAVVLTSDFFGEIFFVDRDRFQKVAREEKLN